MNISLLFGTETGNSELLCDDLMEKLEDNHDVDVANLEDTEPEDLSKDRFYVFVCSTYGEGELPQSAIPFVDKMKVRGTDLSGIKFSVFGLGDTTYDTTYNNGSVVLMEALTEAKAEVLGPRGLHDASGLEDALDVALPWVEARVADAQGHFGG